LVDSKLTPQPTGPQLQVIKLTGADGKSGSIKAAVAGIDDRDDCAKVHGGVVGLPAVGLKHPVSLPQPVRKSLRSPPGRGLVLRLDSDFVAIAFHWLALRDFASSANFRLSRCVESKSVM
jgi:hypothetical protein